MLTYALVVFLSLNGTTESFVVDRDLTESDCRRVVTDYPELALMDPVASTVWAETNWEAEWMVACLAERSA